jgi:hypothetical protein
VESDAIAMLFALRDGYATPLDDGGLPEMRLDRLNESDASGLLDAQQTSLSQRLRKRVLELAVGNPLALVELPAALRDDSLNDNSSSDAPPSLTARLEGAFVRQQADLPAGTRTALLVAAADDRGELEEILAASAMLEGGCVTADAFASAAASGLVAMEGSRADVPSSACSLGDLSGGTGGGPRTEPCPRSCQASLTGGSGIAPPRPPGSTRTRRWVWRNSRPVRRGAVRSP